MGTHRLVRLVLVAVAVLVGGGLLGSGSALPAGATPGAAWVSQSVPTGTVALEGISCPSANRCVAVGAEGTNSTILTTRNGGRQWSSQPLPTGATFTGQQGIPSVSCPTLTHCVAAGSGTILTTDDGGRTWVSRPVPSGVVDLRSVSCPSVTHCVAVGATIPLTFPFTATGDIVTTNDGGITWVTALPASPPPLFGVSCASTSVCVAVGLGGVLTTTDGGTSWIIHAVPGIFLITSVSCSSISTCVAGGPLTSNLFTAGLVATTDGGTTWVSQTLPSPPPGAFLGTACASTITCVAVGGNTGPVEGALGNVGIVATTDGGTTWTNQPVPNGVAGLLGVSCPSRSSCTAVGQDSQGNGVIVTTGSPPRT